MSETKTRLQKGENAFGKYLRTSMAVAALAGASLILGGCDNKEPDTGHYETRYTLPLNARSYPEASEWKFVPPTPNEIQSFGYTHDTYTKVGRDGHSSAVIISWKPKGDSTLIEDIRNDAPRLGSNAGYYRCLDDPPAEIRIGENDALMTRYLGSKKCLTLIELDTKVNRYSLILIGDDFEGPDGDFTRIIRETRFGY
jgi:hypothetical protein